MLKSKNPKEKGNLGNGKKGVFKIIDNVLPFLFIILNTPLFPFPKFPFPLGFSLFNTFHTSQHASEHENPKGEREFRK